MVNTYPLHNPDTWLDKKRKWKVRVVKKETTGCDLVQPQARVTTWQERWRRDNCSNSLHLHFFLVIALAGITPLLFNLSVILNMAVHDKDWSGGATISYFEWWRSSKKEVSVTRWYSGAACLNLRVIDRSHPGTPWFPEQGGPHDGFPAQKVL